MTIRPAYDGVEAINWSRLKLMLKSPAHYHANAGQPDTDAMLFGRVFHMMVLEPERFVRDVAVWQGGRRFGSTWDAFQFKNAGKELITQKMFDEMRVMSDAVKSKAVLLLTNGQPELPLTWTHEIAP